MSCASAHEAGGLAPPPTPEGRGTGGGRGEAAIHRKTADRRNRRRISKPRRGRKGAGERPKDSKGNRRANCPRRGAGGAAGETKRKARRGSGGGRALPNTQRRRRARDPGGRARAPRHRKNYRAQFRARPEWVSRAHSFGDIRYANIDGFGCPPQIRGRMAANLGGEGTQNRAGRGSGSSISRVEAQCGRGPTHAPASQRAVDD